jgi:hypothetical protein
VVKSGSRLLAVVRNKIRKSRHHRKGCGVGEVLELVLVPVRVVEEVAVETMVEEME